MSSPLTAWLVAVAGPQAWIAIDHADAENGALQYLDRSHSRGLLPHGVTDPTQPFNVDAILDEQSGLEEVVAAVQQGGVVLHHGAQLHSSGPNRSSRWRRAYAVHYIAEGARFNRARTRPASGVAVVNGEIRDAELLPQMEFRASDDGETGAGGRLGRQGLAQGMDGPIGQELARRRSAAAAL
eukprot:COSAG03_NODE_333_length_8929_cov_6.096149_8_plen_183_part_00